MEDQTRINITKPGVDIDINDKGDQAQDKSVEQNVATLPPQAVEVGVGDDEPKKSVENKAQTVSPAEDNDNDQMDQAREKPELEEAQSEIENIIQKDLQPINIKDEPPKKSSEEEAKNTTTNTATDGESTNSRRSARFKRATQRFETTEQKTPKVPTRSSSRKLSIIANGNDNEKPKSLMMSGNSSDTQVVVESKPRSNSLVEFEMMIESKPSLMVENRRLSFARSKNIEENGTKEIVVKKRGRGTITEGKRVDELFILKKIEEYQRDGTWREDAVKIRDKTKPRNIYQCKICKKSIDSMWKLYHHRQFHLEMNYYLCQFCLVGFNIPVSRQLHENTCSRGTNGSSVMKNMLELYRNQFKGKTQTPSSTDLKALEQSKTREIKSIEPKNKIIIKSEPAKRAIKRKVIANMGSNSSSGNKTEDGFDIFSLSPRKKKIRTKHLVREGEPEFDASTYDWTKFAKSVKIPGKPGNRYFCLTCKKLQSSKENLFYHMLIHTNEWPFGCNYCERVFRVPANRDKHEESSCLNRQSLSMSLSDIMALKGGAPVLKKMKSEIS